MTLAVVFSNRLAPTSFFSQRTHLRQRFLSIKFVDRSEPTKFTNRRILLGTTLNDSLVIEPFVICSQTIAEPRNSVAQKLPKPGNALEIEIVVHADDGNVFDDEGVHRFQFSSIPSLDPHSKNTQPEML